MYPYQHLLKVTKGAVWKRSIPRQRSPCSSLGTQSHRVARTPHCEDLQRNSGLASSSVALHVNAFSSGANTSSNPLRCRSLEELGKTLNVHCVEQSTQVTPRKPWGSCRAQGVFLFWSHINMGWEGLWYVRYTRGLCCHSARPGQTRGLSREESDQVPYGQV